MLATPECFVTSSMISCLFLKASAGLQTTTVRFRPLRAEQVSNFSLWFYAIHFDEVA